MWYLLTCIDYMVHSWYVLNFNGTLPSVLHTSHRILLFYSMIVIWQYPQLAEVAL
jgi:hypothetical protein